MRCAVILPAAGRSSRYASPDRQRSKLDEDLGGKPLLQRTVELFHTRDDVGSVIVAGPHDDALFADFSLRHADKLALFGVILCRGGANHRFETVAAALAHVSDDHTHVAIHDAARPAASTALIDRVFAVAERHPAVIPGIPVDDTLKQVGSPVDDAPADPFAAILGVGPSAQHQPRAVERTIDRSALMLIQTPQVFTLDLIRQAYTQADLASTDDAGLVERLGQRVLVVPGERRNIKVTHPEDLPLVRRILNLRDDEGRPTHKRF